MPGFLLAALLVACTPGANNLLGLRHAMRFGLGRAVAGIGGRLVAFCLLVVAVVAGLGPLLSASTVALEVIRWAGVAYLVYLGARTLWDSLRRPAAGDAGDGGEPEPDPGRWATPRREFSVAITNPKAILVFTAFVPQFVVPADGSVTVQLAVLGGLYLVAETVGGLVFATAGRMLGRARLSLRARRNLDRGTGVVLIGMAGALAAESV